MDFRKQRKYRTFWEADYKPRGSPEDWRYLEIRGQRGMVYPFSENELAVQIEAKRFSYKRRMALIPGVTIIQDADDLTVYRVSNNKFDTVCRIIMAYKRRVLSPEQRERLIEAGKSHMFAKT